MTIAGQISNGTATGTVPAHLEVTLFVFDASLNRTQQTATTDADGHYGFDGVPFDAASTYVVTTDYRDLRVFASELLSGDALQTDAA
ncbi:MAG: hypothetical protein U0703_00660 [Anaerolineae bacterium]